MKRGRPPVRIKAMLELVEKTPNRDVGWYMHFFPYKLPSRQSIINITAKCRNLGLIDRKTMTLTEAGFKELARLKAYLTDTPIGLDSRIKPKFIKCMGCQSVIQVSAKEDKRRLVRCTNCSSVYSYKSQLPGHMLVRVLRGFIEPYENPNSKYVPIHKEESGTSTA